MKLRHLVFTVMLAGIYGCATVNNPEGGPEDLTPPKLISSTPADQALNVTTKNITLTFDEEIQPKNLTTELLITPNTNNKYKVQTKKNSLTLEFEKELEKNTTYTLNFRGGIEDITKPNKAENLKLSFSTGSFIDSSRVSGSVIDLLTKSPEKDVIVALYEANDTLTIRKNRPYYQTQADGSGNFTLENIKEGSYRIFALLDKNKNAIYDTEEEKIGYLANPIQVTYQTDSVLLQTVRIDTKRPILSRRTTNSDRFTANYSEGISKLTVTSIEAKKDTLPIKLLANGRTGELFKTSRFSGGKTIFTAVDSAGNSTIDTIQIAFSGQRGQRVQGAQVKVTNTGKQDDNTFYTGQNITLELETPIRISKTNPVKIMADSITVAELRFPEDIKLDTTATEISFALPKLNSKAQEFGFILDSTAILPLEGKNLQFRELPFKLATNGGTGSVSGTVTTNSSSYIIQLLNDKNVPVRSEKNLKRFNFRNVAPGQYKIRVLVDENNNGIWDGPDPKLERLAERVYIFEKVLDVRANWEIQDNKLEF